MRSFLFVLAVLSLLFAGSIIAVQPAPAYASSGCGAINGATFTTTAYQAFITEPLQFDKGDQLVYTLTWSIPGWTVTSATISISLGTDYNPVATATAGGNPTQAVLNYEFASGMTTALRFDWGFGGSGDFEPHTITTTISCGSGVFQGAPIPSGFVLRTIVCDVPVYNLPGGSPVGDNKITNGQTWYVNPTPVSAADGSSWSEIFVAGFTNGYVPTSCVQ